MFDSAVERVPADAAATAAEDEEIESMGDVRRAGYGLNRGALSRPSRLKPVPAKLSLLWPSMKKGPRKRASESHQGLSSPPDETIRAEQSPSFLGERTPRTEIAGRWLGLACRHCGHASHEIVQRPVNIVVVEWNVLGNAFSAIGI